MRHALLLILSISLLGSLIAQQPAPAPAPAPTAPNEADKSQVVRERERTIYVPFDELEHVFQDGGKGIFLPYKEFLELWNELTIKRKSDEVKPPQDGVVSRAEYTGHVDGETLVIDAMITVESFKEGWLTVPLAKDGAVPGIAGADTGKAVLNAKPDGYDVILPDKGTYELKLKIYAPIKKVAGKQTVALVLPRSAVSRFTATVPGAGFEFEVNPAAAFTSRAAGADTELSFFFGSGTKFDVAWSRPTTATQLTPLVLASTGLASELRGGSLITNARIDLRILRAPLSSFSFLIPAGQTVQGVSGSDVKDWKLDEAGDKQKLTIVPNAPVKNSWGVNIALESALPKLPAEVSVPEIIVEGATQDRGEIGIAAEPQLDVTPKPGEGLVQQTQSATQAKGLSAVGGYRFLKHPATLLLSVTEAKPQVDVDSLTVLTVKRDSNRVEATFNYNIRRVGIFEARIGLPAGWNGWEVAGLSPDQWALEKTGAAETLVVKFSKQTIGAASVSIVGHQQRAKAIEDAIVPVFVPQGVARFDAKIGVGVPFSLEVNTKTNGDLRLDDVNSIGSILQLGGANTYSGATTINAGVLQINNQAKVAPADTELTLAFRHRGEAKTSATLAFKARDPQVNVEVLTLMEAKEQSLRHTWTLAFDVAYAATDKVVLAVPKSVAGDIRFADPSVKEVHKNFPADDKLKKSLAVADQFEFWEVILRNERIGAFQLSLSVEKPMADGAKEAKLELLQVHVPGVFQETGQVAVVKDDSLEIRNSKAESLEDIDPKELRPALARGGVFLAFKYKSQPLKLSLEVARNAYLEVPQAIVTQSLLTTAVSTDKAQTTEAVYWVKNNAKQFLAVQLPKGARLLSDIFVNGTTQQPMHREGSDDLLVRLPTGGSVRRNSFPVRFVYEMPSPKAGVKLGWWGGFKIEPPVLSGIGVLEAHHQLYLPESYYYTDFTGPMTRSTEDNGWSQVRGMTRLRNIADRLIPAFGPQLNAPSEAWHAIAGLPEQQRASLDFQVPRQGQSVKFHRLGAPAAIDVSFRSRKVSYVYESIAFILVVFAGLRRWRLPLSGKVTWIAVVGLLAIVSTGILSAANGRVAKAVILALGLVAVIWCGLALLSIFNIIGKMLSRSKSTAPVTSGARPPMTPPPTPVVKTRETDTTPSEPLEFPKFDSSDDQPPTK